MTWAQLQHAAAATLASAGVEAAESEARWMVESASGRRGSDLLTSTEPPPANASTRMQHMVERRLAGEPLQYVLGEWEFRGIDLFVDPRVLIPRPETEVTAQVAADVALRIGARTEFTVVDLGTGSGAIAIALARELPDAEVWATDVSADALAVARANVAGAGSAATRVRVAQGDWFAALPDALRGQIRVAVANPPYVSEAEVAGLPPEVADHEPMLALVSGPTGLEAIEHLVDEAPAWLEPGGTLVIEIAPHQSEPGKEHAHAAGFTDVRVEHDLTGRERVLVARVQ